jgi:hypothetical protein
MKSTTAFVVPVGKFLGFAASVADDVRPCCESAADIPISPIEPSTVEPTAALRNSLRVMPRVYTPF